MAFPEVWLLKREIEEYLTGEKSWLTDASSRRMLEIAYYQLLSSMPLSKRVFGFGKPADIIREAVERLKDALESIVSWRCIDLEKEIHLFTQAVHEVEEFADKLYNSLPGGGGEEDDEVVLYADDNTKMVGFSNQYERLKRILTEGSPYLDVATLIGMPGIGKTTLAREVFRDPEIMKRFDCRVWVRVGRNCGFEEMLRRILVEIGVEEDGDVIGSLNTSLKGKRYLIVLDDVWDKYWSYCSVDGVYSCRENKFQLRYRFPDDKNGSLLLIISRLQQVYPSGASNLKMEMELMNREESWNLLREKVFGQERCPSQLEKFGRKIAEKCEGHPLTIVTVAKLLSREDKTAEYWNEVAMRKRHPLFKEAYDEMYKVLLPSFNHLPPCLQECFMYIGMFPHDYEIPRSKLINLWMADGFLELDPQVHSYFAASECLKEVASNSMIMIKETSFYWYHGGKELKTCKLHSSLRYLSNREGRSSKFCHVLDSFDDGFGEDIKAQHRLSFHTNVLFAIKDVNKSVEDNCASTAHSLFCYGPYLQYQVPICFGLRLLKKLDALGIRFYEFPIELLQLVELRYLALTLNGNLPAAVSQLSKLQFLIVHPHQSIKSRKESSNLPMEIWNMQELQHLEVMGKDIPNPCGASLEKLSTLARVSPKSCSVDVLKALPKLEKLGIEVELRHDHDGDLFSCLAHVGRLTGLARLKCVGVNPMLSYSLSSRLCFPRNLTKLTLSGLGYAWKEMDKIRRMPSLIVLKLQNYAFRGPEWRVREHKFRNLKSLIIEDTDIERLKIEYRRVAMENLVLKCCYKLKEFYGNLEYLHQIEIVDCNPIGANQLKKAISAKATLIMRCSWYDKNPRP